MIEGALRCEAAASLEKETGQTQQLAAGYQSHGGQMQPMGRMYDVVLLHSFGYYTTAIKLTQAGSIRKFYDGIHHKS